MFYADYFEAVKKVVDQFDSSDALAIASCQQAFEDPSIRKNIALIKTHFSDLPNFIEKLETRNLPLHNSLEIIERTVKLSNALPKSLSEKIQNKLDSILSKNPSLEAMKQINSYINGTGHLPEGISADMAPKFKFCPLTSDVERSFSAYKLILSDKRHKFQIENLEKCIVVYCHKNYNIMNYIINA